jgi:hypothetical protein
METGLKSKAKHLLSRAGFVRKPRRIDFHRYINSEASAQAAIEQAGRLGLAKLAPPSSIGLELGVAWGYFSDALLSVGRFSRLYSVDAWADHHDDTEYAQCVSRLSKFGGRSVVMRMFFQDALVHFPDDFFDFIYVDAYAHTGQNAGQIFYEWYPKLKLGGIFSGHDYDIEAWPDTVSAVDEFANNLSKEVNVVPAVKTENNNDLFPSWYIIK